MCFAVIWCLLFAWKEVCGLMVPCGSQLGKRQCSVLSLISDSVNSHASCRLDLIFFFLLKLWSGRVIRVFKPLTRYPNQIVGFPKRRNQIRPTKGFRRFHRVLDPLDSPNLRHFMIMFTFVHNFSYFSCRRLLNPLSEITTHTCTFVVAWWIFTALKLHRPILHQLYPS